jgi:hypothetical protein
MTAEAFERDRNKSLAAGCVVALALREPIGDCACYVGEVRAVDERGVRITLVSWSSHKFDGLDFFAPWTNILGMHLATQDYDHSQVWEQFAELQRSHHQHLGL